MKRYTRSTPADVVKRHVNNEYRYLSSESHSRVNSPGRPVVNRHIFAPRRFPAQSA
jgi:hypothetical protein